MVNLYYYYYYYFVINFFFFPSISVLISIALNDAAVIAVLLRSQVPLQCTHGFTSQKKKKKKKKNLAFVIPLFPRKHISKFSCYLL